mmetsp:Transcript_24478/g.33552  ORF Transcript_24478/g.33552 Transcript_24478/m.33552 type:complete len:233 (+) Transcript_24478:913-1611(+)
MVQQGSDTVPQRVDGLSPHVAGGDVSTVLAEHAIHARHDSEDRGADGLGAANRLWLGVGHIHAHDHTEIVQEPRERPRRLLEGRFCILFWLRPVFGRNSFSESVIDAAHLAIYLHQHIRKIAFRQSLHVFPLDALRWQAHGIRSELHCAVAVEVQQHQHCPRSQSLGISHRFRQTFVGSASRVSIDHHRKGTHSTEGNAHIERLPLDLLDKAVHQTFPVAGFSPVKGHHYAI